MDSLDGAKMNLHSWASATLLCTVTNHLPVSWQRKGQLNKSVSMSLKFMNDAGTACINYPYQLFNPY